MHNTSSNQLSNYLYCTVPSHHDCELSTVCTCSTCPSRGLICYLCPFVKPHSDHSPLDVVPLRLVSRGKCGESRHNLAKDLEKELQTKKTRHLKQVQKVKDEILEAFSRYEKKINDDFVILRNEIFQEEEDLMDKFEKKEFKNSEDFKQTMDGILQRIHKKDGKWVYEDVHAKTSQLVTNTRAYLLGMQFQYKVTKEHLGTLIEDTFQFPILDMNIEDYMSQVLFKQNYKPEEGSFSTCRTSEKSDGLSELVVDKMYGTLSSSVDGKSPKKMEELAEDHKKTRTRPLTFGRKQDLEAEFNERVVEQEVMTREHVIEMNREDRRNEQEIEKKSYFKREVMEKKEVPQQEGYASDGQEDVNMDFEDYTIVNDNESDAEFRSTMMETDVRFIMGKDELQRLLKKPDEKFDAITFYPKIKDISLQGFGFYVPLPCEGTQVILEYRVYEGTQKEGKELMREELTFECDIASVKEGAVMERILLKMPVTLEKKKWYTVVLSYLNEVKIANDGGKWKDVGPFVFMGVEKRLVKEWLGMKTIEAEKMYTSQFPYLIYSEF